MIELQLGQAIALYSAILLGIAFVIWTYAELSVQHTQRILEKQHLWRCTFCGYLYLDEHAEDLSQCPRCESFNEAKDPAARFVPVRTRTEDSDRNAPKSEDMRNTSKKKRHHQRRRGPRKRR